MAQTISLSVPALSDHILLALVSHHYDVGIRLKARSELWERGYTNQSINSAIRG